MVSCDYLNGYVLGVLILTLFLTHHNLRGIEMGIFFTLKNILIINSACFWCIIQCNYFVLNWNCPPPPPIQLLIIYCFAINQIPLDRGYMYMII